MRFHAFTFLCVVINGASDPGATCDSKESVCTEGEGAPLGGGAMLQHLVKQSSQTRTDEQEDLQRERQQEGLAVVARVAKGHSAVRAVRQELSRAEMSPFAKTPAEVEALHLQLLKAQKELRDAEKAAAKFSPPDEEENEEEEEGEESEFSLAEEETVGVAETDALDLKDLLLLAAASDDDVNLTAGAMAELGWTPGVRVVFEESVFRDHAWTFKKDGHCLATFAATNDMVDVEQVFEWDPMDFCRFGDVHSGVAGELVGFMQSPEWPAFIEFLNGPDCQTVTSVGHSLGGALASLFAASANRRRACDLNFGSRRDYRLVTYAPFAISKRPFFNGRKGRDFVGTRYGITEIDGGVDGSFALPADPSVFRLAILDYFANLTATLGQDSAPFFSGLLAKANRRGYGRIAGKWGKVEREAVPLMGAVKLMAYAAQPGIEFLHTKVIELILTSAHYGFLSFSHDPVSTLMSYANTGPRNGYKHPFVAFQPLTNRLKDLANTMMARVPACDAPELPRGDFFQDQIALLASQTALPNHQACCYATVANCSSMFTVPWKECALSPFR